MIRLFRRLFRPLICIPAGVSIVLCGSAVPASVRTVADLVAQAPQERQQSPQRALRDSASDLVFKERITPHWFHNNTRFWYRNDLPGGRKEFVVVDAERGSRELAFDHTRLAAALSRVTDKEYEGERLPFTAIHFVDDTKALLFKANDVTWKCSLDTYVCRKSETEISAPSSSDDTNFSQRGRRRSSEAAERGSDSAVSPDKKWTAFIKNHNVFVRSEGEDEVQLSKDGTEDLAYGGRFSWSTDSKTLIAYRVEPGERKEVHLIESSPKGGGRAKLQSRPYTLPGDKFPRYELNIFDVSERRQGKPEVDRFEHEWLRPRPRWRRDGRHFTWEQTDRGHQRFRLIEVDSRTGKPRNIIDEKSETFIWTAHTESLGVNTVTWLGNTDEVLHVSERDGWRHLYLVNTNGDYTQITKGDWVVRAVDRIDETNRQIWFRASGRNADQDPYFVHYYRVNFDGSGLVALTAGDGNHVAQFSPDHKYIIDTQSRVDSPPVHSLRRCADGKLMCKLEEADITQLESSGWKPPEVFVAKGRDGKTDIWGIIYRPRHFDAGKKYAIIEDIYAGPQGAFVPKSFSGRSRYESLNNLGFVVVKIDGMGTANRSKAFHDVCWKNLKDGGFADRILWMKAAAAKYPELDLTRVGVYGNSAGGQNAAAAVLFHPEFYKVAVASCGCHDNRMDKASWNEQWMGYPVGAHYSECSNIDNAHRLKGKLFLIVGEMDTNVPPESTLRLADALIKAGKDFDLLVIPGGGHGMGGSYGQRRMQDFFVRHLLGAEPPDRNAESEPKVTEAGL